MASTSSPTEWTVAGLLDEIDKLNRTMEDRALAFVLGSGASFTSGIPAGKEMAETWLKELHLRECRDGTELELWIETNALGIDGLSFDKAAEFYPKIFERRFRGDPGSGFASLETAMDGREPSLGYSLLAEIMQHTRHKVVITTNFDNLVADALAIHAHKPPLIVGHESLTGYVRPLSGRPLVAKIHRDLFYHPINDEQGVSNLDKGWQDALSRLFKHYMPLVIGYGGNDGSLMGFLDNLQPGDINGRIFWCYRKGSHPSPAVCELLIKHKGVLVAIPGFDEFMLQLAGKVIDNFDMSKIATRIEHRGKKRADAYREQAQQLQKNLDVTSIDNEEQQATRTALSHSFKDSKDWWTWEMRAEAEPDIKKRDHIYQDGLKAIPDSVELSGNYAVFLDNTCKDYDQAEALYQRALKLDPKHANHINNYALFLDKIRKDYDQAEMLYQRAFKLDSKNINIIGSYADFLAETSKDYNQSERLYQQALKLDPDDIHVHVNAASLQLILGNTDAARENTQWIIEHTVKSPSQATAEALLYLALCNNLEQKNSDNHLAHLKSLLQAGFKRGSWNFDALFDKILPTLSDEMSELYQLLGKAILDEEALPALEKNSLWKKIEARPLNATNDKK